MLISVMIVMALSKIHALLDAIEVALISVGGVLDPIDEVVMAKPSGLPS